ncbi:hypothetical protein [uncultured Dysosmobacter sp.]|uniref:hypothetical protein n=1 Tax=uncultured Dysosmobacter sp. TaxID=2591384 RepID=UPI0026350378|nr:hypothetical protein [uncultured Dysosmobacter sp.]
MSLTQELAAQLTEAWSDGACRGYVISAMHRCGFSSREIRRVMAALTDDFDCYTIPEAKAIFERSPY